MVRQWVGSVRKKEIGDRDTRRRWYKRRASNCSDGTRGIDVNHNGAVELIVSIAHHGCRGEGNKTCSFRHCGRDDVHYFISDFYSLINDVSNTRLLLLLLFRILYFISLCAAYTGAAVYFRRSWYKLLFLYSTPFPIIIIIIIISWIPARSTAFFNIKIYRD